ncbi:SRPBCC family protein [Candidatus Amarobacter glycogenicus]|uniref:SRPBCC family protein n=1 Tax=Candidatus Amarobacter glycogenicus TaxID=3140699 RepID=UPI0031372D32|nr:SRPBCC family protein [Dehalococcoidia bacterium]
MRLHRLASRQLLPIPLEEAWAFFSDPRNLATITPPSLNLKPTSALPSAMHPGLIVTYDVVPMAGLRVLWVTEITHVVDGVMFVDEQRAGPYRFWHHQHHFKAVPGGTEMRDIIHYALPLGVLGDLFGARMVKRKVQGIFDYRREVLEEKWGRMESARPTGPNSNGLAAGLTPA